ncbi:DUF1707 domain-containing protein [Kribbella sp. NPDC026611]|uniref:DUF1707 SHOCT-like domain-containing protein n=1 Tax=Kribbella sp. NPDC026611 TaxID=3154911 RepID=UPI0033C316F2
MNDERPGGPLRIGDNEREEAVTRLGQHYEAGRLSAEEHSERVEKALKAKTDADLTALFTDLPGPQQAAAGDNEAWSGPWGWRKPPWTAPGSTPGDRGSGAPWSAAGTSTPPWAAAGSTSGGTGPGGRGGQAGRGFGPGPQWAGRGFFSRMPLPLLIALGVLGVMLSIGCVAFGGHPPVLPVLLVVAGVLIVRKRKMERRA